MPGASFRTDSFPLVDIDTGGQIFVTWADYDQQRGHGTVKLARSTDLAHTWTVQTVVDLPSRTPFYPAVAVKGSTVFIGFTALDDRPAATPPGSGVATYDAYYTLSSNGGGSFGLPVKMSMAASDPDSATTNGLTEQFLGDYNSAAAGSDGTFWYSWTDTRNGAPCAAVDAWRASGFSTTKPNIDTACPAAFGASDIMTAKVKP